jgi:hypothetical protein
MASAMASVTARMRDINANASTNHPHMDTFAMSMSTTQRDPSLFTNYTKAPSV